jgi:hypothetical protein
VAPEIRSVAPNLLGEALGVLASDDDLDRIASDCAASSGREAPRASADRDTSEQRGRKSGLEPEVLIRGSAHSPPATEMGPESANNR